ncbi:riboflavin kinase [Candidatus Woesebacteria bacterium]|nr:riboflavin kinase [Candidatus Woesebacteria bacterium]
MSSLFTFTGKVFRHLGRGKKLGYPTANIHVSEDTPEGIFVGFATVQERKYPALVFVGRPLTFNELDKKAEVYVLDFDQDIYEAEVHVAAVKKLRENIKFESKEDLIAQMEQDERDAREYFSDIRLKGD